MVFKSIYTKRLLIREFTQSDRPALDGFISDPEQLRYMMFSLATPAEADRFIAFTEESAQAEPRLEYHLAVNLLQGEKTGKETAKAIFIGGVALMRETLEHPEAELGYFLLHEHWGKGYAVEASNALVDYAFSVLKLHRVWGQCHIDNRASQRVMTKLDMRHEGTLREHRVLRAEYRSSHIFGVLDREWAKS